MDVEKVYNKYFGEEKKHFDEKMLLKRLLYKDVLDNHVYVFVLAIIGIFAALLLYLISQLTIAYIICICVYYVILITLYTYLPRKCKSCGGKMKRFTNGDNLLFCCDNCETKIKLFVSVGSS